MSAFLYGAVLQWKLDFRNKEVIIIYYIVPLVFFAFMGGIFTAIDPSGKDTLIQSMTVFGVTMGAILGAPTPLIEMYGSEIKKAYKVGGIPLWVGAVNNFLSAFIHLMLMSTVIFFVAPITFDAKIPENILLYFISHILFIVVCLGIGTMLGLLIKNTSKLTMLSQLIFLPSIMLSGIMFPEDMLPEIFQNLGKIFPATWGFKMMLSETFNIKFLIPFIIILIVTGCISSYKLATIGVE